MPLIDFPKELAAHSLIRATDARRVLTEEHSAAFKWLMASFLAINGGGMIALVDATIESPYKIGSGVCFWAGIVCALGIAWRGQVLNRKFLERLSKIEALWATASVTGQVDTDQLATLEGPLNEVKTGAARLFGWASLGAFSVGCAVLGIGLA